MEKNTSKIYVGVASSLMDAPIAPGTGAGSALFVINLCASIVPVQTTGKNIPGLENYRLYQVSRVEDGRTRHRLRLGFFTSESHADSVLTVVRQQYPTAFTACLCDEDRKFARGYLPNTASVPTRPAPAIKIATPAASKTLSPAVPQVIELTWESEPKAKAERAAASKVPAPKPPVTDDAGLAEFTWEPPSQSSAANSPAPEVDSAASMRVRALELTLSESPPAPVGKPRSASSPEPFHVGKGVDIPAMQLSLQSEPAAEAKVVSKPAVTPPATAKAVVAPAAKPAPGKPAAPARKPPAPEPRAKATTTMAAVTAIAAPAKQPATPRKPDQRLLDLDSTQTIRALTSAELSDGLQEKWFAIQLAASEQPVNLDTMPHLDIFEAYRLYSVASAGSGRIVHSLRLGFFKEAVSAEAVCGYLKTFFGAPTVLRISVAEQLRFKDPPPPKQAPEVKSEAKVVDLNNARSARPVIPTVTMEVAPPPKLDPGTTGSFRAGASGSFSARDSLRSKVNSSGTHKALTPALRPAAKAAGPAVRRSEPLTRNKTGTTGKYKVLPRKSLSQELLEEAREVELSESGIRKLPKNDSLLSRLVGRLTK